jgi:membrane-bound metal-dependent hydrolase YbcI (DUF457 family)
MLGRNHRTSGVLAGLGVGVAVGLSWPVLVPFTLITAVAALLPDLDSYNSIATKCLGPLGRPVCSGLRWVSVRLGGNAHRGLTHTLAAWLAVSALAILLVGLTSPFWWIGFAVSLGYLTHLAGDIGTIRGLPLTWPYRGWRDIKLPLRFKAGGKFEELCIRPLMIVGICALLLVHVGLVAWGLAYV